MKSISQEISAAAFLAAVRSHLLSSLDEQPTYVQVRVTTRHVAWPYIDILFQNKNSRAQHVILGPLHNTPAEHIERLLSTARDVALNFAPNEMPFTNDPFALEVEAQEFGTFWKVWGSVTASSRITREHAIERPVLSRVRVLLAA